MKRSITLLILAIALLGAVMAFPAYAKKTRTRSVDSDDKYGQAMTHIYEAKTLLRDYLIENPTGEEAYFAAVQLRALERLRVANLPIVPVTLNSEVTWRVLQAQRRETYTKITLEIRNTHETGERGFHSFEGNPLLLIAEGKVYPLQQEVTMPASVRRGEAIAMWILQPTQTITLDLYFEPLDKDALEGMVKYKNRHYEAPAEFSLVNERQSPPPRQKNEKEAATF